MTSPAAVLIPLTRKAVTLRRCQPCRSSRSRTAILVSKRTEDSMARRLPGRSGGVLYDPGMVARPEVRAWRPPVRGIVEVFHASFTDHSYPMHTHDSWTLLLIDDGMVRYDLDRHEYGALNHMVTLLPPHVPHNGSPATSHGFRKRVLYLDTTILSESLGGIAVDS